MSGILMTVEEYANTKGVTKSAVYKQIKRHDDELKGHIESRAGKMWLDEEATKLLDAASSKSAPVLVDMADKQRMDELLKANEDLKEEINVLKDRMQQSMEMNLRLSNEKMTMLEELTTARALVEEHNSLKLKYDNLIEDKTRLKIELESSINKKNEVETKLNETVSEVDRLKKRNLWQRILNK